MSDAETAIAAQQQGHTWVARLLSRVTALGFGVDALWWRTCLLFVALAVMYHMAALAMWDAIGQWRPCLPWALMMFGVYVDEIGMHFLTGGCRDATPWHDYRDKPAVTADIIRKVALENGPAYLFMCIPNQILMYCFTASTCRAIGRPAPGVAYWAMALMLPLSILTVHFVSDCITYSYIGKCVARDHGALRESLARRELDCHSALLVHRTLNRRVKRVVRFVSAEITALLAIGGLGLLLLIYDYFAMPWGHWSLLVLYVLQCLGNALFLPLQWKAVNDAQRALVELVAEALGQGQTPPHQPQELLRGGEGANEPIGVGADLGADLGAGAGGLQARGHRRGSSKPASGDGETELWDAAERAHFLAHLSVTVEPVRFAGLVVDHGFMVEMIWLFAALAFSMWQLCTLSKWRGFSFDRAAAADFLLAQNASAS